MYKSGKPITFWSAVALGMGAMIGAGIFALLGQAGAMAGSAVYLSFIIAGVIALLSGYSLAKLGSRYPSAGGIVEYLVQCFGEGLFSGSMSMMLYIAAIVSLSLVARTFGTYAATFFPDDLQKFLIPVFSAAVVLLLMLVNLRGARDVAKLENTIVAIKVIVLVIFALVGLWFVRPELIARDTYPPVNMIFYSLSITFFAYEGFRVITNTAEDMDNPSSTLPRAMLTSVVLVMIIYVAVAIAVFGNLPAEQAIAAKDYALAQAALPIFGENGFIIVALAALISTASSLNAGFYSVTNVTYLMAKDGELPADMAKPIGHSREGLVVSCIFVLLLAVLLDLGDIAAIGSISILFVHGIVHFGHIFNIKKTGASLFMVSLAFVVILLVIVLSLYDQFISSPKVVYMIFAFILVSIITELVIRLTTKRIVKVRIKD